MRNYKSEIKISSFYEVDSQSLFRQLKDRIKDEIEGEGKKYILGVEEEEYIKYLTEKYSLNPLVIDFENVKVLEPTITKERVNNQISRSSYETESYNFTIKYPYSGSSVLFKVRPTTFKMTTADIFLNERESTVAIKFKLINKDPGEFSNTKSDIQSRAFTNLVGANLIAEEWMKSLQSVVRFSFNQMKDKYIKENDFFSAINVRVNKDTDSVFSAPTIKKSITPQPTVAKDKEFSSEPIMAMEMYQDILKVVYDLGKSMERKPSAYKDKDEEV